MSIYERLDYDTGRDSTVLQYNPLDLKILLVKPNLPCSVIAIHGVNDVGVSYDQVEQGLCAGLGDRLAWGKQFKSANYRLPGEDDKSRLEPDPDAVFFKRQLKDGHHTPVIPFYWGFREDKDLARNGQHKDNLRHGQNTDRYGNRLDQDLSKGGGPFANATSTLPDMWGRGFGSGPGDVVDRLSQDPLRPVLKAPGRMYMILAAERLAALISMIRDYGPNEAVSLVAHSQGCMLALLAQAFLLERGLRPADTLVLTHPPYSLVDELPVLSELAATFIGGEDALMQGRYGPIAARQTLHARLQTLVDIVRGVAANRHATPTLAELPDPAIHRDMVGARWVPEDDRDNRGKAYLYFCPEDMTVALNNIQGIGWQGVPDHAQGLRVDDKARDLRLPPEQHARQPLQELGASFLQRVFTGRLRPLAAGQSPQPVLVGAAPHDFILRLSGEDDHGHAEEELSKQRAHLPGASPQWQAYWVWLDQSEEERRKGIRRITGEALKVPVKAEMHAGGIPGTAGKRETVDPIDAAISVTSRYGLLSLPQERIDDPRPPRQQRTMPGERDDALSPRECEQVAQALNQGKSQGDSCTIERASYAGAGKLDIVRRETPNEARLRRQQSGSSARSFHSAIFGSAANHRNVTAYDIAIGGGKAVTDPYFYAYLCAVADWRLKKPDEKERVRPGILTWEKFLEQHAVFYKDEPDWRKALIEGNCDYYSTGKLPGCLPVLPEGLPRTVACETRTSQRIDHPPEPKPEKKAEAGFETFGEWLARNRLPDDPKDSDGGSKA